MSKSYAELTQEHDRRSILELLSQDDDCEAPIGVVRAALALVGTRLSYDRLATELAWLQEQGLIALSEHTAKLTARGMDIATGVAQNPGVARPQL